MKTNRKLALGLSLALLAFSGDFHVCAQSSDNYRHLLSDPNVKISQTNLPIIFLNVQGKRIERDSYILAKMKIVYAGEDALTYGDTIAHPGQPADFDGYAAIKWRGNSSFTSSDKKPLAIQTLEGPTLPADGGKKAKVSLLGMGKDNKWATIAPWCDRSMMRDLLTMELARPWMDYAPHMQPCELVLDGTYYGIHLLCERVSKGNKRLNLHDPGEDGGDLTGDFLVEIDRDDSPHYRSPRHPYYDLTGNSQATSKWVKYQYSSPEQEDFASLPNGTQSAINKAIADMETAFASANYRDPDTGYRKYIDVESFIDYMIATELSMNVDGYRLSTNLYKYSDTRALEEGLDPRWKMALWDYNIAYGNADYNRGDRTDAWQWKMNTMHTGDVEYVPFYWIKLMNDPAYVDQLKERWTSYRQTTHTTERVLALVDSIADRLTVGGAQQRNEQAWNIFGQWYIWPCPYYPDNYQEEIATLKSWLTRRMDFLDDNWRVTTGISEITNDFSTPQHGPEQYFDLMGRRLSSAPSKGLYIVRHADGSSEKRIAR